MSRTKTAPSPPTGGATIQIRPGSALDLLGASTANPDETEKLDYGRELHRAARSIVWRSRTGLYPVAIGGSLYATAALMHDGGANPLYVLGGTAALTLAGLAIDKIRAWINRATWRRNWAGGSLALATVWTTAAVHGGAGLDTAMPTLLIGAGVTAAIPWWWFNRPKVGERLLDIIEAPQGPHPHEKLWEPIGGCGGKDTGALPGSFLSDRVDVFDQDGKPNGDAWTINLAPGKQNSSHALGEGVLLNIRSAFRRARVDQLVFTEADPQGDRSKARLTVLKRNSLAVGKEWTGPGLDMKTGIAPISVYPDGSGFASYQFFAPGSGAKHALVSGTSGAGKSGTLKWITAESLCAGFVVWLFDPQDGASFPKMKSHVDRTWYGMGAMRTGMAALEAVMEDRQKWLADNDLGQFDLKHGLPLIVAIFDEVPDILADPTCNKLMVSLSRKARKVGISLVFASQVTSVDQMGDNGTAIKENVGASNRILHRVYQAHTARMAAQSDPVSPHLLPEYFDPSDKTTGTSGLAYVMPGRALPSRVLHLPDDDEEKGIKGTFTKLAESGLKPAHLEASAEAAVKRVLDRFAAPIPTEDAPAAPLRLVPTGDTPSEADGQSARDRVVALIKTTGGRIRTQDLAEAKICSPSQLFKVLGDLQSRKVIEKVGQGEYVLALAESVS